MTSDKPMLFWDFHGTLTEPDITWFDAAMEVAAELAPEVPLARQTLWDNLGGTCLPWFTVPSRDTRHLVPDGAWWGHCRAEFEEMYVRCGFTRPQAQKMAPLIRKKVLEPGRYHLYPDAISTLKTLQKRGYKNYILSNNYPELEDIVTALGFYPLLQDVFTSGKIGYDKPRPEIFAYAREQAGNPANPWMIGDNPQDDIAGGKAAGFTTVAVHGTEAAEADYQLDALAEILDLL